MNCNFPSTNALSSNDLHMKNVNVSNIKLEDDCDNGQTLTTAVLSEVDDVAQEVPIKCETVYVKELDLKGQFKAEAINEDLQVESVKSEHRASQNSDKLMFSSVCNENITAEAWICKTVIKSELTSDVDITEQECGLYENIEDNSESYTDLKSEQANHYKGNLEDTEINSKKNFSSYYKTEEIDIKTEHISDIEEHTSCDDLEDNLEKEASSHATPEPYKCLVCKESFAQINLLTSHMSVHVKNKPYECKHCGKAYKQMNHLNTHMRLHFKEKLHSCEKCGKGYTTAYQLRTHMWIHTEEKPFKCKECGKTFTLPTNLSTHMRLHTGEKPYTCKECGKAFNQKSNLNSHMRLHTDEKPYKCEECGKVCRVKSNLSSHMRIHTVEKAYVCKECGKAFNHGSSLKIHMRLHTGESPYECKECGKVLSVTGDLNRHMRLHTEQGLYECETCGQAFKQKCYLKKHMKVHTGEKS